MDETQEAVVAKTAPIKAVYQVRITLRGDGDAPTLNEIETAIEEFLGKTGDQVSTSAERVDR